MRTVRDSMGEMQVPESAMYGATTARAVENFPISNLRFGRAFLNAIGLIKDACAQVNKELGLLDADMADLISAAAADVAAGMFDDQFPIDIFQTGSGTSTNMNANEVITSRAKQLQPDAAQPHPNDHVNMGQSSNDVIPTAISVSAYIEIAEKLLPALKHLEATILARAAEFDGIVKTGRTHLMDATPVRLSDTTRAWATQVRLGRERIEATLPHLARLAIGGTAVGSGLNAHPEFGARVSAKLSEMTGLPFVETDDHFEAQASQGISAEVSGALKATAADFIKIANDLRHMNSGPISGLGEIVLPALQPGSSIMPGKINPVIAEATMMVSAQVIGNDATIAYCAALGNFELNVMLPILCHNLLESIEILASCSNVLADKAIAGFTVNVDHINDLVDKNPIMVTALNPIIGYETGAKIAKRAYAEKRTVKDVAAEMTDLTPAQLDHLLDPAELAVPGIKGE
ncbi:MAG: class II fumarate hydratase [Thermomicrobiales bacterium]|nr:class II fumarate hydratase [Thermomicrobiales bacterium]MCO5217402.1 class II fumarate hydratase [Thermomicrobiales bacterium]MCO5224638.1 class II fumarate hydratase [Thermomicrobiales bacterium]MCO5226705.1 class II fumarate hydratase [Thermomicrobiales bacterium]